MFLAKVLTLVLLQQCSWLSSEAVHPPHAPRLFPELRIVKGSDAIPHEVPSMVYLTITVGNLTYACDGTLIEPQFVLTAAHCFNYKGHITINVYLGCHKQDLSDCDQTIVASTFVVHEAYATSVHKGDHDIAVVKLSVAARLEPGVVQLARLHRAVSPPTGQGLYDGQLVVLYGWGVTSVRPVKRPSVLQRLVGRIAPYSACSMFSTASANTLCMKREHGTAGVGCFGDSGGPLLHSGLQIGIVSGGAPDCIMSPFTVFTRVDYHRRWLENTIGKMSA